MRAIVRVRVSQKTRVSDKLCIWIVWVLVWLWNMDRVSWDFHGVSWDPLTYMEYGLCELGDAPLQKEIKSLSLQSLVIASVIQLQGEDFT